MRQAFRFFIIAIFSICCVAISPNLAIAAPIKIVAGHVEIKGNIRELELRPNTTAEWTFVPIKSGTYELHCAIAGHTEAGMHGSITIQPSP